MQHFKSGLKPSKKHLMYGKKSQNRGLNQIGISQYELPTFLWFFHAKSDLVDSIYEFWKYIQASSQDFRPRKAYFFRILQWGFLILHSVVIWNINTHIPKCFSSIWDGLKSIFASLESVKFCVDSFKITISLHFHEFLFQPT